MQKLLLWLLPALSLLGCRSSQKVASAPQQVTPTEKALLWKISGNGLKKPSYLYGTIHLIPKSELNFSDALRSALDHTNRLTFEIDMKEMTSLRTQLGVMTKAFMNGGKTLRDLLSAEDYAFVKEKMTDKGLPAPMLERLKPLFLSTMFSSDEGGDAPATGEMTSVEMELYRMAKRRHLETGGLETTTYQMSIFDSIPYQVQAKMLVETLRGTEGKGGGELEDMLKLYRDQDINAMQAMLGDDDSGMKGYEGVLLNNRNQNWIPIMGRMMRNAPTLFAVGAGHLGGPSGVIALLRKSGYRVEAVTNEG